MIDTSSAEVQKIIVHRVGNRTREEGYTLSTQEVNKTKYLGDLLLRHYLLPLANAKEAYNFYHESDIELNAIDRFAKQIFLEPSTFKGQSQNIAKHLYSASTHSKIVGGELIVILFKGLIVDGSNRDALGIYRIETRDSYLDVKDEAGALQLIERTGISLNRIQKGALILSHDIHVLAIDTLSHNTKYWLDSFLKVAPRSTPKTCAKVGGALLKAVSSKVSDPNAALELGNRLSKSIQESETISMGELKAISSAYVSQESLSGILSGLRDKSGFELSDDLALDTHYLAKNTKTVMKQTRIIDGISLVMSKANVSVSKIMVEKTPEGLQAVIDIEIVGG
jgi:hypothetical protein